jgi:beta-lactam-binding protein with PASTA domain
MAGAVAVPAVVGLEPSDAITSFLSVGLVPRAQTSAGAPGSVGRVTGQTPAAGTQVPRGSVVVLDVAEPAPGGAAVVVPPVVGQTLDAAVRTLSAAGLRVQVIRAPTPGRTAVPDRVIAQYPMAGAATDAQSLVRLYLSR